ncbi:MAG: protein kinase [Candidatus Brocadiae bacterium]|nr:protein kinase [Candidatus Brocadiia bacterium]
MLIGQIQIISELKRPKHSIAPGEFLVIGRGAESDVILNDSAVSKAHCKIFYEEGEFQLQDLQSRNFTYINDKQLAGKERLKDSDIIKLGRSTILFKLVSRKEQTASLMLDSINPSLKKIVLKPQEDKHLLEDDLFAHVVLSMPNPTVSRERIEECRRYQKTNPASSLKKILLEKKYIQTKELQTIQNAIENILKHEKSEQSLILEDSSQKENLAEQSLFLKLARAKGFLNIEQIHSACLLHRKHKEAKNSVTLLEILLNEQYLTSEQAQEIQNLQKGHIPYHIEGYELISLIGVGGMAYIYKARQISMDRMVAIKILLEGYRNNQYINDLFLSEARAVAKLNHENIIAGYDFGEKHGISYFVMEYVDGISLSQKLKKCQGRLQAKDSLEISIQVAKALDHAWEQGLVHRDIKPENILLTNKNIIKLCDLGLAQKTGENQTAPKEDFGTPAYMSPEQIRSEPNIDIRSDIYSLGVTLYRMVFGSLPFSGSTRDIMSKHLSEKLRFPGQSMTKEKGDLAKIIHKMMEKNARMRYQTPKELLEEMLKLQKQWDKSIASGTMEVMVEISPSRLEKGYLTFFKKFLKKLK